MSITVTTAAASHRLTRKETVKAELGVTVADYDDLLDSLNDGASAAIVSYCRHSFAREALTETCAGFGDIHLQLSQTPIVSVTSVTCDSTVVTDYSVGDANKGWLYRRNGWGWTVQTASGLSRWQRWPGSGIPLPRQEEPQNSVVYTAGYILPSQNRIPGPGGTATISVDANDNSFNDSAGLFPSLLLAGDIVQGVGWTNEANKLRATVVSATASKIVVSGTTLVTEAADTGKGLIVSSLPADVEKAATEAVKTWFAERRDNSNIIEKALGPARVRFSESRASEASSLPPLCVGLLAPYVRWA